MEGNNRQGLAAAAAGVKRKRDAVDGDGSGSGSSDEQSPIPSPTMATLMQPPTLKPLQELVNTCRDVFNGPPTHSTVSFVLNAMGTCWMPRLLVQRVHKLGVLELLLCHLEV